MRSETLPLITVQENADNFLIPAISQLGGVARVSLSGDRKPSIRIQVDPAMIGSLSVRIGDEVYDGTVKRQLERAERAIDRADLVSDIEPEVRRHLVVARARGMQPPGSRADQFRKPVLDVHMDVFERALELELARADL